MRAQEFVSTVASKLGLTEKRADPTINPPEDQWTTIAHENWERGPDRVVYTRVPYTTQEIAIIREARTLEEPLVDAALLASGIITV